MAKTRMATEKGICYLCGHIGYTEEHHIFGKSNRKRSEHYGLKVYLCPQCHRAGKNAVHKDPNTARKLHQDGQAAFERTHSRQQFIREFGKNYL